MNLIIGQNGIVTKAQTASSETKQKAAEEKILMLLGQYSIEKSTDNKELTSFLDEQKSKGEFTSYANNGDGTYTVKVDGYDVTFNESNLKIKDSSKTSGEDVPAEPKYSREGLNVGDYIDYSPSGSQDSYLVNKSNSGYEYDQSIQRRNFDWKILNINQDGSVDIVSATTAEDTSYIYFKGAQGYNNGLYTLNDACKKMYSNTSMDAVARSINIQDIERHLSNAGKTLRDGTNNGNAIYGKQKTYTSNLNYPNLYANENNSGIDTATLKTNGLGLSDNGTLDTSETQSKTASNSLTVTQYYYNYPLSDLCDSTSANTLKTEYLYWIASRYVDCSSDHACFGMYRASSNLSGNDVYLSNNDSPETHNYLRPVVTIKPTVNIIKHAGTTSDKHKIESLAN